MKYSKPGVKPEVEDSGEVLRADEDNGEWRKWGVRLQGDGYILVWRVLLDFSTYKTENVKSM